MQLKKCKFCLKWFEKHVFLLKNAVLSDVNLLHSPDNIAKSRRFLEIEARGGFLHLALQVFQL